MHHFIDGLSDEVRRRKLEQMVLQLHDDVIKIFRRLDQRPREWYGLLPHAADAFEGAGTAIPQPGRIVEGVLAGDLAPSTGDGANETTASLNLYDGAGSEWSATGGTETVTNRDDGFSAKSGEYIVAVELASGELRPIHFPALLRLAKTDAAHNKSSSGTVSVYTGTAGSESDTGDNATAYNKFADLETGKWVVIARIDGDEYLVAGEC